MRIQVPISRSSEMIDGHAVFMWVGAHSVDTEWKVFQIQRRDVGNSADGEERLGPVLPELADTDRA